MLKINSLKIDGLERGCVTDRRPNIAFALESDRDWETLDRAIIESGKWRVETRDQLQNSYGGELRPFGNYEVRVTAIGASGDRAEAMATFEAGRLGSPWEARWITDGSYRFTWEMTTSNRTGYCVVADRAQDGRISIVEVTFGR